MIERLGHVGLKARGVLLGSRGNVDWPQSFFPQGCGIELAGRIAIDDKGNA
jgi:hypothetical protein